ncbi:DUF5960 family protein [Streptococcus ictaluri]|uniref:Uncharacterized protein n=1 Tax=Streptococcus ictaluri 707-05 TaxID=764299 RepID=G5K534_9STRE|nr:DUF5960 family protein [Streptococcus ictaluri]EHI69200.1 hypothetical protein STRIC_1922 [Streptococcus ictaluri 707-05]
MTRRELYEDKLQLDYMSESYLKFEEDFYKYSNMKVPLTFLTDDILLTMAKSERNYFKLNKENAKDNRDYYFVFNVDATEAKWKVRKYEYVGERRIMD